MNVGEQILGKAGVTRTLRGWHNPRPIAISIRSDDLALLREGVQRDLDALMPRCEALDRLLPEFKLSHRGYVDSKLRRDFLIDLGHDVPAGSRAIAPLSDPAPRIRQAAVPERAIGLAESLKATRSILTVGDVADPALQTLLTHGRSAERLASGDGVLRRTRSGRSRPAAKSFSTWMSKHDEAERARVGAIVLSRAAGRPDVDLLRRRLHRHQIVFVEAGSPALTWLLAQWDGTVVRYGGVFAFTEPGDIFSEPSTLAFLMSGANWPRISVVTISYNQNVYLEQCLRSVLDQRYPNLEFIVIDAGSTDGSIDILRRYEPHLSHLVIEPDEGQSDGLNKGFRLATGDILTWVNSDDMLAPMALKRAALAFSESGADMVTGTCSRVGGVDAHLLYRHHSALPTGKRVAFDLSAPLDYCDAWEKGDFFFQPEVLFTKDIWERAGGYLKPHLYWAMDWDLWLRCAMAGATVIRIPDVLAISRKHEEQKTTSDEAYLWQITAILREYDDLFAKLERETVIAWPQ